MMPPVLFISLRADHGGGPAHLWMLLDALCGRLPSIVACPDEEPYWSRFTALVGAENVHRVPHRSFSPIALNQLVCLIRQRRIGLIHSHGKGAGLYSRLLSLLTGVPCVHTFHGMHIGQYGWLKRNGYLWLERLMATQTRALIAVSDGEYTAWQSACNFPSELMHCIKNGVPVGFARAPATKDACFTVATITRFDHQKFSELCWEVFTEWKKLSGAVTLRIVMIGDGPGRAAMEACVDAQNSRDSFVFIGQHPAPRELLASCDAYLSTSRWEGMPLALIEAAMEGVPLVVSDVVGNRDVVDLVGGSLYPLAQPRLAAEALWKIAGDVSASRIAADRAQILAQHFFSVTTMAAATLHVYELALQR